MTRNTLHPCLKPFFSRWFVHQGQSMCRVAKARRESLHFVGADEVGEDAEPEAGRPNFPINNDHLNEGQGQVALSDGSVDQVNDTELTEQIDKHLAARGGHHRPAPNQPQPPHQPLAARRILVENNGGRRDSGPRPTVCKTAALHCAIKTITTCKTLLLTFWCSSANTLVGALRCTKRPKTCTTF